jgi:hypothetical protein
MTPILGILASQISGKLGGGSSFDSIATQTVGSNVATVSFTSIPSTYKHLQIRFIGRDSDTGTSFDYTTLQYNSDSSSSNYTYHVLSGNGSAANGSGGGTGIVNYIVAGYLVAGGATASVFGAGIIDILDYANTSKYKTTRTLSGWDKNGAGNVALSSGVWLNTSAISSIVIGSQVGNLVPYTQFALYGVKG